MQILDFAREELSRFLGPEPPQAVHLRLDQELPPFAFALRPASDGVHLVGHDEACVLHAVYTLLEQLGLRFELTGPLLASRLAWERVTPCTIHPRILRRGIRQHINFPMDISGYSIDEAREYIRNLARLRFNHITFHSYPNQWISGPQASPRTEAGRFFYGQRYDLPDIPLLRDHVRNAQTFCIPELEAHFEDTAARSQGAQEWLRALMAECRRCGLRVQCSFEPRAQTVDVEQTLSTARHILASYPDLEVLELITQEAGLWGQSGDTTGLWEDLEAMFGTALQQPVVQEALRQGPPFYVGKVFRELGHHIRAAQALAQETSIPLVVGVYCAIPSFHAAVLALADSCLPAQVSFAFLPGHGAERVAKVVNESALSAGLGQRMMIYNWLEFDGTMYLQQNAIAGIEAGIKASLRRLSSITDALPAMAFNHWRTAENRMTARYAAEACLDGSLAATDFTVEYAKKLFIAEPQRFATGMDILTVADRRSTNELPNIGFCFVGCWGRSGLGYFAEWSVPIIGEVKTLYQQAREHLRLCQEATRAPAGSEFLSLMCNRLDCTVIYLEAIAEGCRLQEFTDIAPTDLNHDQRQRAAMICNRALALLDSYLRQHAEMIVDRGCEGTLISCYHTPIAVLKRLRHDYGGISDDDVTQAATVDEPPSPIQFADQNTTSAKPTQ